MKYRKRAFKKKAGTKKKRYTRKRKSGRGYASRATTGIIRSPSVVPDRMFMKLKYAQNFSLTVSAGTQDHYVFNGNDLNDPNYTGGGHQPLGYDQWCEFYERYAVFASSITLRFVNEGSSAIVVSLLPKVTVAAPVGDTLSEKPYLKRKICSVGQEDVFFMKNFMSTKKMLGYSKIDPSEDDFGAVVGSAPARQWRWLIAMSAFNGSATCTGRFEATITYYCVMMSRKSLLTS